MNKLPYFLFIFFPSICSAFQSDNINCPNCNLIIISLSNVRPRNMSLYGYQRPTTPGLEKYFKNDFLFSNAIAPASLTFVDALSFFYSLNPIKHQTFSRKNIGLHSHVINKNDSLTSLLKKANYKTAAFVSEEDYDYNWGMSKGFDLYFDKSKYADYGITYKPQSYNIGIKDLATPAINWINKNKKSKFFLFLQSFDLHCPYGPNDDFSKLYASPHSTSIPFESECFMNREPLKATLHKGKSFLKLSSFFAFKKNIQKDYLFSDEDLVYLQSRYDAELTKTDFYLYKFLQQLNQLGLEKNSIIMIMSEHGDNLGENNFYMKSNTFAEGNLHNANLNFALILKIPNHKSIQKIHPQIVQTIDLAPTLLDLLKLNIPQTMQGKSLKPVLNSLKEINDSNYGFSIRYNIDSIKDFAKTYNQLEVIQNHDWKYYKETTIKNNARSNIVSEKKYLFNLKNDPDEKKNLASSNLLELQTMKRKMESKAKLYSEGK